MPHPDAIRVAPRHPSRTGRRASGIHVEVVELHTLPTELVDIRSLNDGVAITTEIAVALIVRHHHDDIGALRCRVQRTDRSEQGEEDNFKSIHNGQSYVGSSQSEYAKPDDLRIKL